VITAVSDVGSRRADDADDIVVKRWHPEMMLARFEFGGTSFETRANARSSG
jgi:hypothetical protein